jgi:hypothetical protein
LVKFGGHEKTLRAWRASHHENATLSGTGSARHKQTQNFHKVRQFLACSHHTNAKPPSNVTALLLSTNTLIKNSYQSYCQIYFIHPTFFTMFARNLITRNNNARRLLSQRFKATQSAGKEAASEASTTTTAYSSESSVPIGASLIAAFAAISTVSAVSAGVEYATASSCLPYSHNGQRFDQDEFMGRFSRMLLACDPRLLMYSEAQVLQAQSLLERADGEYAGDRSMDRTLWEARRIVDAALHPDTKEFIPMPFRMSGYVPFNGPICVAMVASTSTLPLLFWAWVNQSQNALVNYYVS